MSSGTRTRPVFTRRPVELAPAGAMGAGTRSRIAHPAARLAVDVLLIALMSGLALVNGIWAADALVLALLLTLPGVLLLRLLGVPAARVRAFPPYVPCASIAVVMAAGAAVNFIGPALGDHQPLRTLPLLAGVSGTCLVLALLSVAARADAGLPWSVPQIRLSRAWPLVLPLISGVGAALFNNGHGRGLAIAGMAAAVATVVVCIVFARRMSASQLATAIFGVALAAGWSFSLRSHFVYGWDIASEYRIVNGTYVAGIWHSYHPKDAYAAMLSLTTFPATLTALAGMPSLFLLKVVYPVLFALFPVGLFKLANRVVGRRYAFMAAAFLVVQGFFFQQMSGLARQEVGLLVFIALFAALLEADLPRRTQWPLVVTFAFTLVVSHYSTTYLAIDMFVGYCVIALVLWALRRGRPAGGGAVAVALVATLVGATVWYMPVTQSGSNVGSFLHDINTRGFDFLPSAQPGQSPLQTYLTGNIPSRMDASKYQSMVRNHYDKATPWLRPYPSASQPRYTPRDTSVTGDEVRSPRVVHGLDLDQTVLSQAVNILAVLAAAVLAFRRRSSPLTRKIGVLGLATVGVLALMRVSGTVANDYTPERAIVQLMVPLVIAVAWLLEYFVRRSRLLRLIVPVGAALALGGVFLSSSGLRAVVAGGPATTNVADRGEDYERFYVAEPELAAARWLNTSAPKHDVIHADRYGQLRIYGTTPRAKGVFTDVMPELLDQHSWVYAYSANTLRGRARARYGDTYALYEWPSAFLRDNFNLVYDNGSARVYHGP
jgi:uncharacterized membrane protein